METLNAHESTPLVFESPPNLYILMDMFEEFTHLCHLNHILFWIDWGTALGAIRHTNIIPWDIDCDVCLTKDNYQRLLELFERNNNCIGNLICDPDGYNDRHGCCWIQSKKYRHLGVEIFGIDCVCYQVDENFTKTLMSQEVIDAYPVTPASYDYSNNELFPLKLVPLVGNFVFVFNKTIERIKDYYVEEGYLKYPVEEYNQWMKYDSSKPFLLHSPLKTLPEVLTLADGFKLNCPFVIRNPQEFNVELEKLKDLFIEEQKVLSWYETKQDIFTESLSHNAKNILYQWENDTLTTNVTDSPCKNHEFLPKFLADRAIKLDDPKDQTLCYILTNKNTLTKFHRDNGGGGWIYLKQGKKLWWFISPEDTQNLEKNGYPLEKIRELSFTELVFLRDYYLWGKIHIVLQEPSDFVFFPEHWSHRVFTYDRAIGIGGYSR